MTDKEAWLQVVVKNLSIFSPRSPDTPKDAKWYVRDNEGKYEGFGSTPLKAIEDAVKS